ncbi:helix-turn-helix transcriptional regulator [Marinicellulosiphila megalodicopiae]|uniref:helix-turn-helix transcriptional regulator n=1 Tax=Marinicellulosiphila megalodicopiae TaxID=2724896 RepID=UPI003BB111EB
MSKLIQSDNQTQGWTAFIDAFVSHFNLQMLHIMIIKKSSLNILFHVSGSNTIDNRAHLNDLHSYIHQDDFVQTILSQPKHQFYFLNETLSSQTHNPTSLYFNNNQPPLLKDIACANMYEDDAHLFLMSIERNINQPSFDPINDSVELNFFIPFITSTLKQALKKQERTQDRERSRALVEMFRLPIAVFTEHGELWAHNQAMQVLISENKYIDITNKTLQLSSPDKTKLLQQEINNVLALSNIQDYGFSSKMICIEGIRLACTPLLHVDDELSFSGALVYAIDSTFQKTLNPAILNNLFSLTKKESETCIHLMKGLIPKEISKIRDVSEHTVRGNIKEIYKKTKCNNQISLMNLLCSLPSN